MPSLIQNETCFVFLAKVAVKRLTLFFSIALVCTIARSQSIYVDLDINDGDAGIGHGAPSTAFGGAAGVPGFWNLVPTGGGVTWSLRDIQNQLTPVTVGWTGSGGDLGYRNSNNTGDYALLLNDAERVGAGGLVFTITGLLPGAYHVITYAVKPQGELWTTMISVPGSSSPNPQAVTGPMPGNQLIFGITHCIHDIQLSGEDLLIQAADHQNSYVNGFQILAVPEPSAIFACALGLAALVAIRRRRM